jgi:adenylylsulfate kinase
MRQGENTSASTLANNVVWQTSSVTKAQRAVQKQQTPYVLWFTGYSGAGKSTVANAVEQQLFDLNLHTYLLDGDNIRHGLNKDLNFNDTDRTENIRRVGETTKLFLDAGLIVITAFISPFRAERQMVRELVNKGEFIEIFMNAPLEICEGRDPKGLYKKARAGEIDSFTAIDSNYEPPLTPDITLDTSIMSVDECVANVLAYLRSAGKLQEQPR